MTKQQLDKGNDIYLKITQCKQRVKAFKNLFSKDPPRFAGDHFKIHYLDEDGLNCSIDDHDWDYENIVKALIKHENETIEKLEKEFEEL